jgi:hypothetical protein
MDAALMNMNQRLANLEFKNKQAKSVLDLTKYALNQAKSKKTKDTAHIETCEKIVNYWESHIKINNYEKLLMNTILSEKADNIIKIAPNLRQKYLNSSTEICELHKELVSLGRIKGFDEYNYMKTCKKVKEDVEFFTDLCDMIADFLIE